MSKERVRIKDLDEDPEFERKMGSFVYDRCANKGTDFVRLDARLVP